MTKIPMKPKTKKQGKRVIFDENWDAEDIAKVMETIKSITNKDKPTTVTFPETLTVTIKNGRLIHPLHGFCEVVERNLPTK